MRDAFPYLFGGCPVPKFGVRDPIPLTILGLSSPKILIERCLPSRKCKAVQPQDLKWGMPSLKKFGAVQPKDFKWRMPSLKEVCGWPTHRFGVKGRLPFKKIVGLSSPKIWNEGCLPLRKCKADQHKDLKWGVPSLKKVWCCPIPRFEMRDAFPQAFGGLSNPKISSEGKNGGLSSPKIWNEGCLPLSFWGAVQPEDFKWGGAFPKTRLPKKIWGCPTPRL